MLCTMNQSYNTNSLTYTLNKLKFFIFQKEKANVITMILISILLGTIISIDGLLLQKFTNFIESLKELKKEELTKNIIKYLFIYIVWWEGINTLFRIYDYIYMKTMPKIKAYVISELYHYVQYYNHDFFQKNLTGDVSSRIIEAARSIEMIFSYINEKIIRKISMLIFSFLTIYSVNNILAVIFLVWFVIFIIISLYYAKKANYHTIKYGKNLTLVTGKIVDAVVNIPVIRMFSSYLYEKKYLLHTLKEYSDSDKQMQWFMFKLCYILTLVCIIMISFIIYFLLYFKTTLMLSTGQCIMVISICMAIAHDLHELTEDFSDILEQTGVFFATTNLYKNYIITDHPNAKTLKINKANIEFKNVSFYYNYNNNIFNNQSIFIHQGQKVGLAGFSGSGKTTFTNLIIRLFDTDKGDIYIDGYNIKYVTQKSLRDNIALIPQNPLLFQRTIMENIKYGSNATDEEAIQAAKKAFIHQFIKNLPNGYNTICKEKGSNLSYGEKQRIIIARAILKNAPILILDEATSAIDAYTENVIQKSLNNLMKNKTVLIIAHKLYTLLNMDRILVFDKGYIIEDGTHKDLSKNGRVYQLLWESFLKGIK